MTRTILLCALLVSSAAAQDLTLAQVGTYADPLAEGEGLQVIVQPEREGAEQVVATWYTYDLHGQATWLIAQGPIGGALDVFAADRAAGALEVRPVGAAVLDVQSCTVIEAGWLLTDPALPDVAAQTWRLLTDPVAECVQCPPVDFSPRPPECEVNFTGGRLR